VGNKRRKAEGSIEDGVNTPSSTPETDQTKDTGVRPQEYFLHRDQLINDIAGNLPGIVFGALVHPDKKITFTFVSERITEVLGLPCELEGLFERFVQQIVPEDLPSFLESAREAINTFSSWSHEVRFIKPTGEMIWFKGMSTPSRAGDDILFNGIGLDITQQKRAVDALRESEERWQFALEGAGDGVWDWNAQTNEVFFSRQWKAMLGFEEHEISNRLEEWDTRLHPEDREKTYAALNDHFNGVRPVYMNEHRLRCKDGSYKWILDRGKVIRWTEDGKPLRVIGTHSDISERKRIEQELLQEIIFSDTVINSLPGIFFLFDTQGHLLRWNTNHEALLGYSLEEMLNLNIRQLIRAEDTPYVLNKMQEVFQQGYASLEVPIRTKSGDEIPYFITGVRLQIKNDAYLLGTGIDMTAHKQTEAALRESEENFRAFVETSNDWVWAMDATGRHTYSNGRIKEIIGYDPEEILGGMATDFIHPDDLAAVSALMAECIPAKKGWQGYAVRFRHKDGHYRWMESSAVAVVDSNGALTGFRGADRDITDRVQGENDRIELERRLFHAQKLESLGVLAGGIAHDFNNILMAILGNLDMALLDIPSLSPARESIEQSLKAVNRAADLTRQMLAYSGKGRFVMENMDLNVLVEENTNLFRSIVSRKITMNIHLAPSPVYIEADPPQVQQIIMNLLTNASEAIGDAPGLITLCTGMQWCDDRYLHKSRIEEKPTAGQFVFVDVSDTGCGMETETLNRMFEPFFTTKFTGRGLGLPAVLGIVRGHHGAIMLNSALGSGTTVRVLFPACEPAPKITGKAHTSLEAASLAVPATMILIVDDEEAVRNLCAAFVERMGHPVLCAANGEEALTLFHEHVREIACILLDLTMPRMDGVNAFRQMKRIRPDVKVILCSGYDEQEATQRFTSEGLAGFIQKPYRLQELKAKIEQVLKA